MLLLNARIRFWLIDILRGTNIHHQLKHLRTEQYFDEKVLNNLSKERYLKLLGYANEHCAYYKYLFSNSPEKHLTKDLVRANKDAILSDNYIGKLYQKSTGGSTGNPLVYFTTNQAQSFMWAAILLSWESAGYKLGDRIGFLSGTSMWKADFKHSIFYKLLNVTIYSAFNIDDTNIKKYLESIVEKKISILYGYASVLEKMAEYIIHKNIIINHSLKSIVSSAEILTDQTRNRIQMAFNVKVYNQYGCNEGAVSAFECEHRSLHLINTASWVFLDKENNLIATNLVNMAFPFIHYQTGDRVLFSVEQCKCKRGYPVIKEVLGRQFEFLKDMDGKLMNTSFFAILFRSDSSIQQYQVQFDSNSITIVLKLNTDEYHYKDYQQYVLKIREYMNFEHYRLHINIPFFAIANCKHLQVVDLLKYKHENMV